MPTPDEIKLGRVGHYSWQQACQEARICYVHPDGTVNVAGDSHEGDHFSRRLVPIGPTEDDFHEFHLNKDCPWEK